MRKLACYQVGGQCVQEILDEFNERADEFGVQPSDVLSVSAFPPTNSIPIQSGKETSLPKIEVAIVYWTER